MLMDLNGYEPVSATIITDAVAHEGRFVKLLALENCEVTEVKSSQLKINGSYPSGGGTNSGVGPFTFEKGAVIEGIVMTSIKLTNGTAIAYDLES